MIGRRPADRSHRVVGVYVPEDPGATSDAAKKGRIVGLELAGSTNGSVWHPGTRASSRRLELWVPVALGPVGAAAGVAGFFSRRMAKTALPMASAAIVANGLQGTYLQARGIAQKPGGWRNARYNTEMGPPLLVTMVGGMGLLAAVLRREH